MQDEKPATGWCWPAAHAKHADAEADPSVLT
jgi:hypothetical protein